MTPAGPIFFDTTIHGDRKVANQTHCTCEMCRWLVVNDRESRFCHRRAPVASQDDGSAWFPYLEQWQVDAGCADHEEIPETFKPYPPL